MSALALKPVPAKGYRCDVDGCNRVGNRFVQIASYPVRSPHKSGVDQRFRLCNKHAAEWRQTWDELAGVDQRAEAPAQ